jgi:hypothetical protein
MIRSQFGKLGAEMTDNKPKGAKVDDAERIKTLEARLAKLEAREANSAALFEQTDTRRRFLRLAGAATVGVMGAAVARPASAANGDPVVLGSATNTGTAETVVNQTAVSQTAFIATSELAPVLPLISTPTVNAGFADGIRGVGGASDRSWGVSGSAQRGIGVRGESDFGYALFASGNGRIGVGSHGPVVPSPTGAYDVGDLIRDASGNMAVCVVKGQPGTFRRIAGPGSAGQMHFLPTPVRAYDSTGGGGGVLSGGPRTINLGSVVPAGATAIAFSLTVFNTYASGFLTIYSADLASPPIVNSIQWTIPNTYITTTTFSAINSLRQVKAYVYPGALTNFQIDVLGYFV